MNIFYYFRSELGKIIVTTLGVLVITSLGFIITEPSNVRAATSQAVVVTLNVTTGVAVTVNSNSVTMSTALDAFGTNSAVATSTFTVVTNDPLGYTFTLGASTGPAMKSGSNVVADYSTTTAPSTWSVASGDARFGFSVFGPDRKNGAMWGSGSLCDSGTSTPNTNLKYTGFAVVATTTAGNTSTTTPAGNTTTVCYAVQQNNTFIPGGVYTATITGTATTN